MSYVNRHEPMDDMLAISTAWIKTLSKNKPRQLSSHFKDVAVPSLLDVIDNNISGPDAG